MEALCLLLIALGSCVAFVVGRYLWELIQVSGANEKVVLISGCDTGFGHMLALRLARRGCVVFAGCLSQKGEDELRKASSDVKGSLETFSLDVSSEKSVSKAAAEVKRRLGGRPLWGIVNNAGIAGRSGMDCFVTAKDYADVMEVNTLGVIRLTHAFKSLVKKSGGRIVTVASVMGRVPQLGAGPYCVSKYAVEGYCDVLRQEMALFGVKCPILEPGYFATNLTNAKRVQELFRDLWSKAEEEVREDYGESYYEEMLEKIPQMISAFASPHTEWVVDAYEHALLAAFPRHRYHVGWDSICYFIPMAMTPSWLSDWLAAKASGAIGMPLPKAALHR